MKKTLNTLWQRWLPLVFIVILASGCVTQPVKVENPQALADQAQLAYDQEDYPRAGQLFNQLLADPDYKQEALLRLGNIAYKEKKHLKARDYYQQLLQAHPNHAKARYNLALSHLVEATQHLHLYQSNDPAQGKTLDTLQQAVNRLTSKRAKPTTAKPEVIWFARGSRSLGPDGRRRTSRLAEFIKQELHEGQTVWLRGSTHELELAALDSAEIDQLSVDRAWAVRKALQLRGVDAPIRISSPKGAQKGRWVSVRVQ